MPFQIPGRSKAEAERERARNVIQAPEQAIELLQAETPARPFGVSRPQQGIVSAGVFPWQEQPFNWMNWFMQMLGLRDASISQRLPWS